MKSMLLAVGCLLFAMVSAPVAGADSCASGNLSGLMGTTCDIGSLQFTFSAFSSENDGGTTWTASNFTFTPVSDGFSLSFDGGPQSVTSSGIENIYDYALLNFGVIDLDGMLTGESVTGGTQSSSAGPGGTGWAIYEGQTFNASVTSWVEGYNQVYDGTSSELQNSLTGAPFSIGPIGFDTPFYLLASNGGSASWDGSPTTFTYDTTATPVATPEASTVILLGTALLGLASFRRKRFGPSSRNVFRGLL